MDLLQVKKPLQAILSQKPRREMPMCGFWLGHALQRKGEMMVAYLVSKIFFSWHDMLQQKQRGRMRWNLDEGRWNQSWCSLQWQCSMGSHDESVMNIPRRSRPMLLVQKVWRFVSMSLSCNTPKTLKNIPLFCAEKGPWSLFFSCCVGSCLKWHFLFSCCSWTPEWFSIVCMICFRPLAEQNIKYKLIPSVTHNWMRLDEPLKSSLQSITGKERRRFCTL